MLLVLLPLLLLSLVRLLLHNIAVQSRADPQFQWYLALANDISSRGLQGLGFADVSFGLCGWPISLPGFQCFPTRVQARARGV